MPLPIGRARILPLIALIFLLRGTAGAFAQSIGPDESPGPHGGIAPSLALTPSQKSVLYQAALQQRGRAFTTEIDPTVGAAVSRSVPLSSLPDQAGIDDSLALKYAMVQGDIVVVDPVQMRVIDIIRGSARP